MNDTWKIRQKKYTFNGWYWGPFLLPEKRSFSLTFKKGRVVGKVSYYTLYKDHNTFSVNQNGFINCPFHKKGAFYSADYIVNSMGIVTQYTERNDAGKATFRFNIKPYTERLAEAYVNGKITKDSIINTGCHSVHIDKANKIFDDYGSMIDEAALLPDKYGGDKTVDAKEYGKLVFLQYFDKIDYQKHPKWEALGLYRATPIENKKTENGIKEFLRVCSKHIPAQQVSELQDAIAQFEEKQHEEEKEAKEKLEMDSLESDIVKGIVQFSCKGKEYIDRYNYDDDGRISFSRGGFYISDTDTVCTNVSKMIFKFTQNIVDQFQKTISLWDNTNISIPEEVYSNLQLNSNQLSFDTFSIREEELKRSSNSHPDIETDLKTDRSIFKNYIRRKKMLDTIPSFKDINTLLNKIRILTRDKKMKRIRPVFFSILDEFNHQMDQKTTDSLFAKEYYDKINKIVQVINSTDDNCKQLAKRLKKEHSITDKINLILQ